jgi:arylformamidase
MQIVDLSHIIKPGMTVYPGTEPPVFSVGSSVEKDGFKETLITMFSHTGTHIDCPAHIFKNGISIDEITADKFIGNACVITCKSNSYIEICPNDVSLDIEFILIKTGWSMYWGDNKYFGQFPVLSEKSIELLLSLPKLKGIGIDAISVDPVNSVDLAIHKKLLSNNILIVENLTNLEKISTKSFIFSCLPLKIEEGDGSPVRAVAIILD